MVASEDPSHPRLQAQSLLFFPRILNKAAIRAWFLMPLLQHAEQRPTWQAHPQPFLEVQFWMCLLSSIQSDAE